MKTRIIAKAVLLNDKGDMLVLRRSKTDTRRPLQWDLPGGTVDEGEELSVATVREVEEETGIKIQEARLDLVYADAAIREDLNVVWVFFVAKTTSGKVQLSFEHDKYEWVSIKNAINMFEYPLQRELLTHIYENDIVKDLPL